METTVLRVVAKKLGARVRNYQEYDSNVCHFTVDAEHNWKPVALRGYPFSEEMQLRYHGRKVLVSTNSDRVRVKVEGELDVGVCSINKANEVQPMEKSQLSVGNDLRWPVFILSKSHPSKALISFLGLDALRSALERLLVDKDSSLHIFQGGVTFYSKTGDADRLIDYVDTLSTLVGTYSRHLNAADLSVLPERFHHLIPLILEWSVPNDQERSSLLDQASSASIRDLVEAVVPEFEAINHYLDSLKGGHIPEPATDLGRLAEAASEAKLRLAKDS
jgi:hypothetical protein